MTLQKALSTAYQIGFPKAYNLANALSGKLLRRNEYGNRQGLPELFDKMHMPEQVVTQIMARRVMELMVKPKAHEPEISRFMLQQHGELFVDVGAWLGYYSFLLAGNFRKVLAVEPDPRNMRILKETKSLFDFRNIRLSPYAISDRNGLTRLFISHFLAIHGESSLVNSTVKLQKTGQTKTLKGGFIKVKSVTLTRLLKHVGSVDLIKVDVEGGEWKVLEGAKNVMHKIGAWMIELHDSQQKQKLNRLMESHGYETKWLDQRHGYFFKP